MAEPKKVKIIVLRPLLHESKPVEVGTVLELPEAVAIDVIGTKRAILASAPDAQDQLKAAKEIAAAKARSRAERIAADKKAEVKK